MCADAASPDSATLDCALRLLGRRALTASELRGRLAARGHSAQAIDAACADLTGRGYLDDGKLALEFIVSRAARRGLAPARLVDELCARGVERAVAESALRLAVEHEGISEVDLLRQRLRRLGAVRRPLDRRGYARLAAALGRAGFDEELIRREIDPYRGPAGSADEAHDDRA